ncbi:TadA family conjugal transfer-associated ATPase [Psychromicrobium xiongbiense]|uniref:TadA family conjugal transfer-associated ATPase n=1 Tax=Psychromicrobium xiongbiense TaxID=3051184 RepID=UPI0025549121|nr:TadA family conjugal transfer-associated ATPase [Psychromicrobium sp. YIM S02556]
MSFDGADNGFLETVRQRVIGEGQTVTGARVAEAIRASGRLLGTSGMLAATERIRAELTGLGPLDPLVNEPGLTDIYVNAPQEVWWQRGNGLERVPVTFDDEEQVRALAVRLVAAAGKRLDESTPCLDVRLPGGIRVHAVLPPLSAGGTVLSFRLRRPRPFSLEELQDLGSIDARMRTLLRELMASRLNVLITGSTGSGKTSLLATLLGLCPARERLVLVEDTAELNPDHPHVLGLESRAANVEGQGGIGLDRLVHEALRMNPDRLLVGECRGAEIRELFTALNTGHAGGGTLHANSAQDVPARLQALGALAGMTTAATNLQAASALDVVIHCERHGGVRRVSQIGLLAMREGELLVHIAASCVASGTVEGPAWAELQHRMQP